MRITLDISLYPLRDSYIPAIDAFIAHLQKRDGLEVLVNALSTQVQGESGIIFEALRAAVESTLDGEARASVVVKILPGDIDLHAEYSAP